MKDKKESSMNKCILVVVVLLLQAIQIAQAEWDHELELEFRYFADTPQFDEQGRNAAAIIYRPIWSATTGNSIFDFRGIVRYDENDEERQLIDITELSWLYVLDDWEFKAGIAKVFWGVAETQHLVDIINQTDLVDDIDTETKLGQPLLSVSRSTNIGVFDVFVLPFFRERTFPGEQGRLRTQPFVNTDLAVFESDAEETNIDYAARWSHTLGIFDVGVSYFNGTGRDPVFTLASDNSALIPNYVQIEQVGLDLQATTGSWLFKLEAIDRSAADIFESENFHAAIGGFEYSFFDLASTGADIGIVVEHSFDSRGEQSFSDDLTFVGVRLAINDEQSTDLLIGCSTDGRLCSAEGSRRFGDSFKLSLRANSFSDIDDGNVLASQRDDDFLQLNLAYFF